MIESYHVARVIPLGNRLWHVDGRAYIEIKLSDILLLCLDTLEIGTTYPLKVVDIYSYGAHLHILGQMMSGAITLEGENGENLVNVKMLYRSE